MKAFSFSFMSKFLIKEFGLQNQQQQYQPTKNAETPDGIGRADFSCS